MDPRHPLYPVPGERPGASGAPAPWRGRVAGLLGRLVEDEAGTSHFEYALIAVFTGTALIAGLIVLRGGLENFYTNLSALLDAVR